MYIIIINFFAQVFSECTEAVATSLIPLVTKFPEIYAFIITPHAHRERGKVIGRGVHIYIYIYIYMSVVEKKI